MHPMATIRRGRKSWKIVAAALGLLFAASFRPGCETSAAEPAGAAKKDDKAKDELGQRRQSDVVRGLLIAFFAFAYMYAKGYEGGSGVVEGIRFGVLVALMVIGFGWIWMYVSVPITGSLSIASMIDSLVELPLYGAIVGAVYKPLAAPAARAAAI